MRFVLFNLDGQIYALHLRVVERAVRSVEITPLPKAPEIVLGVVNFHGEIIPVFNLRKRFRLPEKEISVSDQFIVARTQERLIALVADSVEGVVEMGEEEVAEPSSVAPGIFYVQGIMKLKGDIVLIHDLDLFLSLSEIAVLDDALTSGK